MIYKNIEQFTGGAKQILHNINQVIFNDDKYINHRIGKFSEGNHIGCHMRTLLKSEGVMATLVVEVESEVAGKHLCTANTGKWVIYKQIA